MYYYIKNIFEDKPIKTEIKMKKKLSSLALMIAASVLFAAVAVAFSGCANQEATYEFDGKTIYLAGEEFDSENTKVKKVNSKGKVLKEFTLKAEDVSGFSTESAKGNKVMTFTVDGVEQNVTYFVCAEPVSLADLKSSNVSGSDAVVYRDIMYGTRVMPEGSTAFAKNSDSNQDFDVYLPTTLDKLDPNTPVFLAVHGGGWMSGNKTTGDTSLICKMLAKNGYVVFAMNYILATLGKDTPSFNMMVSDIGSMVAHMKLFFEKNGLTSEKIAIGGISAGGHLSTLYAYKHGATSPLKIAFELDIVGPTQIADIGYKKTLEQFIYKYDKDCTQPKVLVDLAHNLIPDLVYGIGEIENGSVPEIELIRKGQLTRDVDLTSLWELVDTVSPITYVTENSCPTIMAYGQTDNSALKFLNFEVNLFPEDVVTDTMVPTTWFYNLKEKFDSLGVPNVGKIFEGYRHEEVASVEGKESLDWILTQFNAYAELYLK